MLSMRRLERAIGVLLLLGTLLSAALVLIGSFFYLVTHGETNIESTLPLLTPERTTIMQVWQSAFAFTPLGVIELGLLTLVTTQLLRVGLLCYFYVYIRDWWFTIINLAILLLLIYSSFWRT